MLCLDCGHKYLALQITFVHEIRNWGFYNLCTIFTALTVNPAMLIFLFVSNSFLTVSNCSYFCLSFLAGVKGCWQPSLLWHLLTVSQHASSLTHPLFLSFTHFSYLTIILGIYLHNGHCSKFWECSRKSKENPFPVNPIFQRREMLREC